MSASPSDLPAREAIERAVAAYMSANKTARDWGGQTKHDHEQGLKAVIAALQPLSQGNGEAVAWLRSAAEQKLNTVYDLNPAPFGYDHEQASAYCNGRADVLQWIVEMLPAAPPSQPEGVREALEDAIEAASVLDFARAVLHGDDEHRTWLLEAAQAFIDGNPLPAPRGKGTTPSRGLVEAAEWHEKQMRLLDRKSELVDGPEDEDSRRMYHHEQSAKHFRTLSAKPTANVDEKGGAR